jgi:hypothetical protein
MASAKIQSVKFKKDYMMLLAFLLFFLIVSTECFLVVWLPSHLKLDSMWADQVARQELVDQFDRVRGHARHLTTSAEAPGNAEGLIICRSLDRIAPSMHKHSKSLSPEQCRPPMEILQKLYVYCNHLNRKKAFSAEDELQIDKYVKNLHAVKNKK